MPRRSWSFIVADVKVPILGADFLRNFKMSVDLTRQSLGSTLTTPTGEGCVFNLSQPSLTNELRTLLSHYKDLFSTTLEKVPPVTQPCATDDLQIMHFIVTSGPPVHCVPRRLPPEKEAAVAKEINLMLKQGIIRPSSSPWASPVHVVPKASGGWRPCGDYRRLNLKTQRDNYPLPNIYDFASRLHGARIFSKMDILKGFWQVPVNPEDIPKTAINTTRGLFEFLRMPFGLRNAPSTFQRLMDGVIRGLNGVFVYMDDLLVYGRDYGQHRKNLELLLQRLRKFGLKLSPDKCEFERKELNYLGFYLNHEGVRPPDNRIRAISTMPRPITCLELRKFLGALNFYKRFLPKLSTKIYQLYSISNNRGDITWTPVLVDQFESAKQALKQAVTLSFPVPGAPLCISTDASGFGIAAVLEQYSEGAWKPLAYFSRKMSDTEKRDSTFNRELLSAFTAVKYFRHYIEGRSCSLVTDHAPLKGAFYKQGDALTDKQRRYLSYLSEMVVDIHPISGKYNIVADLLSRLPGRVDHLTMRGLDVETIARHQQEDFEMTYLRPPRYQRHDIDGFSLVCDMAKDPPRICVPAASQTMVLRYYHDQAHPGVKQTRRLISQQCVWPNMTQMVQEYVRACAGCQKARIFRHNRPPLQEFVLPNARFSHVHMDFVGPLPESSAGNRFLMTFIDRYTRFPVAVPLKSSTAEAALACFMFHWVALFGLPDHITTDNGPCFTSLQWKGEMQKYGIRHHYTTAYHPQSNGLIERWHRTLKDSLAAQTGDWERNLPLTLLHLRTAIKDDLKYAPAELVFGAIPNIPGSMYPQQTQAVHPNVFGQAFNEMSFPQPSQPRWHRQDNSRNFEINFDNCTHVFVRKDGVHQPLTGKYAGPFRIIERNNRAFKLLIDNREHFVSIDRLKPATFWRDPALDYVLRQREEHINDPALI